jgi:hypothetical protein
MQLFRNRGISCTILHSEPMGSFNRKQESGQ